jgi:hypothetical protein
MIALFDVATERLRTAGDNGVKGPSLVYRQGTAVSL